MSPATWGKQGKPPHPGTRPGAAPAPVAQPAAVPWQDAGRGWSLWPRGFTRPSPAGRAAAQDCTFGVPAAAGRAPEAAAPRLPAGLRSPAGPGSAYSLFPITAGAGLCATTPHQPQRCRGSQELRSQPRHLPAAAAPLTTSPSLSSVLHHSTCTFKHL